MSNNKLCIAFIDPIISAKYLGLTLQELGIEVVAVFTISNLSEDQKQTRFSPECFTHAIYTNNESERDFNQLIKKLQTLKVEYVFYGYEGSIELTDKISQIICPSCANNFATALRRFDKYEMQEALREANIPSIKQLKIYSRLSENDMHELQSWDFPVIIKSTQGSSSIGVKKCETIEEIQTFLDDANYILLHGSEVNEYVIQEYLSGTEYFVNTACLAGAINIASVYCYKKTIHTGQPIYRYVEPIDPQSPEWKLCCDYAFRVIEALGLKNGLAHIELFLTDKGPRLVELNARISGASGFVNRLSTYVFQTNQLFALISLLKKQSYAGPKQLFKYGRIVLLQNWQPRTIGNLNVEILKSLPSYIDHLNLKPPGTFLSEPVSLLDSVAYVLLVHENKNQLLEDYEKLILLEESNQLF